MADETTKRKGFADLGKDIENEDPNKKVQDDSA